MAGAQLLSPPSSQELAGNLFYVTASHSNIEDTLLVNWLRRTLVFIFEEEGRKVVRGEYVRSGLVPCCLRRAVLSIVDD